jgi:hypothetical protein
MVLVMNLLILHMQYQEIILTVLSLWLKCISPSFRPAVDATELKSFGDKVIILRVNDFE